VCCGASPNVRSGRAYRGHEQPDRSSADGQAPITGRLPGPEPEPRHPDLERLEQVFTTLPESRRDFAPCWRDRGDEHQLVAVGQPSGPGKVGSARPSSLVAATSPDPFLVEACAGGRLFGAIAGVILGRDRHQFKIALRAAVDRAYSIALAFRGGGRGTDRACSSARTPPAAPPGCLPIEALRFRMTSQPRQTEVTEMSATPYEATRQDWETAYEDPAALVASVARRRRFWGLRHRRRARRGSSARSRSTWGACSSRRRRFRTRPRPSRSAFRHRGQDVRGAVAPPRLGCAAPSRPAANAPLGRRRRGRLLGQWRVPLAVVLRRRSASAVGGRQRPRSGRSRRSTATTIYNITDPTSGNTPFN